MLEKELQVKITKYAKTKGCLVYKFSSPSNRHVQDLIIFTPYGVSGLLEVKRPGEKLRPAQENQQVKCVAKNILTDWADQLPYAKHFINDLLTYRLSKVSD